MNNTNMGFNIKEGKLNKIFKFKDFSEAIQFINNVAKIAEEVNHHPDIKLFNYKYVEINISTHDENNITEKDYSLANLIDKIILNYVI